ncbi:sugar kinase [bacterium]|nr:sugar kinase [bacterium]
MERKINIGIIGECLVELSTNCSLADTSTLNKYYGGDTVTTAVTVARLKDSVSYITKIGKDGFGDFILNSLTRENIDTSFIQTNNEQNGMYVISKSETGRDLLYYKRKTAATKLALDDLSTDDISKFKLIYSTGVVQSLSAGARELIRESFKAAKENDVITAYDPNYSSCFMNSDSIKECFEEIIEYSDIVFMSMKNNSINFCEINSAENIIKYLADKGVKVVVIKSHIDNGYYTGYNGAITFTEFYNTQKAIDTTASGDVFNGGFLYAITNGYTPSDATKFAAIVSGLQTQNYGAIQSIPYKDTVMENV